MTTITIITTVLNNKDLILDSINCIKNQSYKNIQHIIIDGGSTDGTYEILKNCKNNNYNFDLINHIK